MGDRSHDQLAGHDYDHRSGGRHCGSHHRRRHHHHYGHDCAHDDHHHVNDDHDVIDEHHHGTPRLPSGLIVGLDASVMGWTDMTGRMSQVVSQTAPKWMRQEFDWSQIEPSRGVV